MTASLDKTRELASLAVKEMYRIGLANERVDVASLQHVRGLRSDFEFMCMRAIKQLITTSAPECVFRACCNLAREAAGGVRGKVVFVGPGLSD